MTAPNRITKDFRLRTESAEQVLDRPWAPQAYNADLEVPDGRGIYTKGLPQQSPGRVDLTAYAKFRAALQSQDANEIEASLSPPPLRTQNGPLGGLSFPAEGYDWTQFEIPPPPAVPSHDYAFELLELYWAALARDIAFTSYGADASIAKAAAELQSRRGAYKDLPNAPVTPANIFRGPFVGETSGDYLSAFLTQPAEFGSYLFDQKYRYFPPQSDFMIDETEFQNVEKGVKPSASLPLSGTTRPLTYGRDLAAYTRTDVLYQAYLVAAQVLDTFKHPPNPGSPYTKTFKRQNGFCTFGGPDIAATLAFVANEALKAVWWQKWFVHLRHRPESGGAIAQQMLTGQDFAHALDESVINVHSDALIAVHAYNTSKGSPTYFLPQAFPEGSPMHPAYPTGHGTVAGACITVLKFFFDGTLDLEDRRPGKTYKSGLKVNGELNKLASNISFGHGIHAGIHWRSDTTESIRLGEKVAIAILRDRARYYDEKFGITIQTVDNGTEEIHNN